MNFLDQVLQWNLWRNLTIWSSRFVKSHDVIYGRTPISFAILILLNVNSFWESIKFIYIIENKYLNFKLFSDHISRFWLLTTLRGLWSQRSSNCDMPWSPGCGRYRPAHRIVSSGFGSIRIDGGSPDPEVCYSCRYSRSCPSEGRPYCFKNYHKVITNSLTWHHLWTAPSDNYSAAIINQSFLIILTRKKFNA